MRSRDLVMIVVSFLAMLAGSFLPGLAEPLAPFPRLCLIVLLYLGFLSVGTEALFIHTRLIPGTVSGLVLIRLFALPLLSFFLFKLLMPQFALGALLVGAASIGVVAPVRESGDIAGSGACKLMGPAGEVELKEGVIAAKRHIHATPEDAEKLGVKDKDVVSVKIDTEGRSLVFGDVVVRVSPKYALAMHIDTDESNAAGCGREVFGEIVK